VLLSLIGNCVLSAVAAFCQTEASIVAIRFSTGLLTISTPSLSWMLGSVTQEAKSQAIARWISGLLLGIGAGSMVGGYVGRIWGLEAAMLLVSAQGLVVIMCCI